MEYTWIKELLDSISLVENPRRSIFEIVGVSHKEAVNSNLLAYFLDRGEDHGLSEVFLNSLSELISTVTDIPEEIQLLSDDFEVHREFSTNAGGRIDLLIACKDNPLSTRESDRNRFKWAIIIENKLGASLTNDLDDYWDSVTAGSKIGLVLSVFEEKIDHKKFKNILHDDLSALVARNVSNSLLSVDGLHFVFLKEYLHSIKAISPEMGDKELAESNRTLRAFQKHSGNVRDLLKAERKLVEFVAGQLDAAFKTTEFPSPKQGRTARGRHYCHSDATKGAHTMTRFWVHANNLLYDNELHGAFELHGKSNTVFGDELKQKLREEGLFTKDVREGMGGKTTAEYCQIYSFDYRLQKDSKLSLAKQIEVLLATHLIGEGKPVNKALEILNGLIKKGECSAAGQAK